MTRTTWRLPIAGVAILGLVSLGGVTWGVANVGRPDCPGKIVCPQTGELICRDQCPTVDPARPDCPGRIVCPLTGELVCKDRCPLTVTAEDASGTGKACCDAARK